MSNPSASAAIEYEAESSFGEDVATFATHRPPALGSVDVSGLFHNKIAPDRVTQRRNDGTQWILMDMGGSIKLKMDWAGHGVTTLGSPSIDPLETLWGLLLGNAELSAAASTTLTGAGTAASPTTVASGTFDQGGLCRIGTLGDGAGNGQFYAINTHSGTTLNLIGAMHGAPVAAGVVYPVVQMYGSEDPTAVTVTTIRLRILTGNLRYEMHGVFPTSYVITGLGAGERPQIEWTLECAWWRYTTASFPSAVTSNQYNPAMIAAGSLNVQAVGTTTRNVRGYRNLTLEHTLGMVPLRGPGGVNANQKIVGVRRLADDITLSWVEEADAATLTPVLPGLGTAQVSQHIEWTGSTTPGSAIGFKAPRACITNVPIQMSDEGLNRLRITAKLYTGTDTSSDRACAAIVYANG